MKSYTGLPAQSEESHYEYPDSHLDIDVTGYLNPMALNTDDVKYATIKDNDVANFEADVDNAKNTNYLELSAN